MRLSFDLRARIEFFEAVAHYEAERTELSEQFADEIIAAIARVIEYPLSGPLVGQRIHRMLVRRFPYAILYEIDGDLIRVATIMHTKRKPPRV